MVAMTALRIRFKKRKDASVTLTFLRADGSVTQSTIGDARGFGPVHDLTHYVVESTLGISRGFLGLIAEGWTVRDFEQDAKSRIPNDAVWVEGMAGALSFEVMAGQPMGFDESKLVELEKVIRERDPKPWAHPEVAPEDFDTMRDALAKLVGYWRALPPGRSLELSFEPGRRVDVLADVEPQVV